MIQETPADQVEILSAFTGFGIEIEYMIVDNESLNVRPVTDQLLRTETGDVAAEIEQGPLCWSNELVMHVLELKVNGPVDSFANLSAIFHNSIVRANTLLAEIDHCRLMPGAMHPWMNPPAEAHIWPYEGHEIYATYDRIFNCKRHGWANLQSVHINLPFADDNEFARLHTAIRLVLPILPALAASSPFVDGSSGTALDCRLQHYRVNQTIIPVITGPVIPEPVNNRTEYEQTILEPIYAAIKPYDPDGILQHEWLNSRGAITRFDRQTIEIRLIDTQECPSADIAIVALVVALVRYFYEQTTTLPTQVMPSEASLQTILNDCIRYAEKALIADPGYLTLFGLPGSTINAGQLWKHITEMLDNDQLDVDPAPLKTILTEGTLASRLLTAAGPDCSHGRLVEIYSELCNCLHMDRSFHAGF